LRLEKTQVRNIPALEQVRPNQLALAYSEIEERYGFEEIPGILKCFSARPDVLWNYVPFAESLVLDPGHLSDRERMLVATLVSAVNESSHCTDMHGYLLKEAGGDPAVPIAFARGETPDDLEPKDKALLEFARMITLGAQRITPADVDRVRQAGWSDEQIAEATLTAAYMNMMNRLANAFGVPPRGLLNLC
jgi:uncharacterized peroxidase-related enzyme